jgi:hypothetical protein
MRVRTLAAAGGALLALAAAPAAASAHLHPFNPAAACAPEATGAGNEAAAFFSAPGVQEHWEIVDLAPEAPGTQFLIQLSNPGKADESSGAIAPPGIFVGNPGTATAAGNCAQPKP